MKSLYIASIGMINQQTNVDVISNNLANINTPGFKKSEINFTDIYFQGNTILNNEAQDGVQKTDINASIGLGSKTGGINRIFSQGVLQKSENPLDLAIEGEGFFRLTLADGTAGYTRDGSFRMDAGGNIVSIDGFRLQPPITINQDFTELAVSENGEVSIIPVGSEEQVIVGNISIFSFPNPAGLKSISGNIFQETQASGAAVQIADGYSILQGYKEMANVNVIEEMVNMIAAQRAYEINSKAVKTADEMMHVRNNLR